MNVTIRKFEKRDIDNKIRWINDNRNNQYLHYDLPLEYDKTLAWFERTKERTDRYDAVIEADGKPVGLIGLLSIDRKNGKAEYYITLGEQKYKRKGIASKASALLLDYAFGQLDLNKVYLYTEVENKSAQRLFERIGFVREGLLKDDLRDGQKTIDRYAFAIRRLEYEGKQISQPGLREATPIQESAMSLYGNRLFIKREDLLPFSFGGNKARKAQYFFKDILEKDNDCVVTYGSSSSNHCRVVANMAAARGLPCYIVSPTEDSRATYNSMISKLLNAHFVMSPVSEVSTTIDKLLTDLRAKGLNPYFIQGGGHGNLGTQAYVDCYHEIVAQEKQMGLHFDYIFLASGTGTTQAGLICGQVKRGDHRKIVGISIARKNPRGEQVVADSVREYMEYSGKDFDVQDGITFLDDYVVDGYGSYNKEIRELISEVLIKDSVPLDTTYTGKAFWGMQEYLYEKGITNKKVLFIHTGGTPLFFDDLGELISDTD